MSASDSASQSESTSTSESLSESVSMSTSESESVSSSESSSASSSESSGSTTLVLTVQLVREDTLERVGDETVLTVGANQQRQRMKVTTTEMEVSVEATIVLPGLLYIWHDDNSTASYVDIGYSAGTYSHRLIPGECALIPLAVTCSSLFIISDAISYIEYEIHERALD